MAKYFLSPHSYVCETAGHAVFLDLKHDKYTAVPPEEVGALRAAVRGWSATSPAFHSAGEFARTDGGAGFTSGASANDSTADTGDVLGILIKEGLLTADASMGKEATPVQLETPTGTFWTPQRPWPQLTSQHLRNFVSVWALTTLMLRTLPISYIVNRARRRKEREAHRASPLDMRKAHQLAMIHFVLQPAFYSAKDACLRNSLTLVEFLARYEIYPTWAFGVHMEPFAAHSWVQHGPVLFTDPVDHVKTFTPIMVI